MILVKLIQGFVLWTDRAESRLRIATNLALICANNVLRTHIARLNPPGVGANEIARSVKVIVNPVVPTT